MRGEMKDSITVYLAGGFHSGWQEKVINSMIHSVQWANPREHGLEKPEEYSAWDFFAIRQCDIMFAYLEEDNPGGYSLALEIGYAHGLGKLIILVNEKASEKYLSMLEVTADCVFRDLAEGIKYLSTVIENLEGP